MDLTHQAPRSPNELMDGLVSLARMTDKARAFNEGKLGEYHYDCPHDKPLLAFLGVSAHDFAKKAGELNDSALEAWIATDVIADKSPEDIAKFNEERRNWRPEPGSDSEKYFNELHDQVAPNRSDVKTWFDLLDIDEKREVAHAHA